MKNVRVILYGVGVIGSMIGRFLANKPGLEIVGAVDVAENKIGKDLGDILGMKRKTGISVSNNIDLLKNADADIAVHATSSFLRDTFPQISSIVANGVDVVSTCEELSYPFHTEPKLAQELDTLAKEHGATVLGTGINPGFLMDTLVIALTAPCHEIRKINVTRKMNAATRRVPFQKKIGAGLTRQEFKDKMNQKKITGHVGLEQSIAMIADALAWKLDKIVAHQPEPVIAAQSVESQDVKVPAGYVSGLKQKAKGVLKGHEVITLNFQAYIGAEEDYDSINILGTPPVYQKISPCIHGDAGTTAMIANALPKVINAVPGLVTMKDLPIPSATTEDMRSYIFH